MTRKVLIESTSLYTHCLMDLDTLSMMCPEATGCWCTNMHEILSACHHLLVAMPHPVYTEETLQVTIGSWVTAKTFPLLDYTSNPRPSANSSRKWRHDDDATGQLGGWWCRSAASSSSTRLHSPLWAVRKLSLPSQRLLGIQWSRLRAVAVTNTNTHQ